MPIALFDVIKEHAPARPPEEEYKQTVELLGLSTDYTADLQDRVVCLTWNIVDWEQFKRTHHLGVRVAAVWPFESRPHETSALHVSGDMKSADVILAVTPEIAHQLYDCDLIDAVEVRFEV